MAQELDILMAILEATYSRTDITPAVEDLFARILEAQVQRTQA